MRRDHAGSPYDPPPPPRLAVAERHEAGASAWAPREPARPPGAPRSPARATPLAAASCVPARVIDVPARPEPHDNWVQVFVGVGVACSLLALTLALAG